jgi:TolB-like protein
VSLDNAISGAAEEFSYNLKRGSKVAIVSIRADASRMSNYLIEELNLTITRQRVFTLVDRVQIEGVQRDFNFRISEDVSDATAQAIGKKLGAQVVVTGSFESVGNYYRFRVRAIEVDTAAIAAVYSANVQNDQAVASLMGVGGASSVSSAPAVADYDNFNAGQRWGTWALNQFVLPGLGSYVIMRDPFGGTFQLVNGVTSYALVIVGFVAIARYRNTRATYDSYDYFSSYPYSSYPYGSYGSYDSYPYGSYGSYPYGSYSSPYYSDRDDSPGSAVGGIVCLSIGGALYMTNVIFNIVRSAAYDKPQPKVGSLANPNAWSVAVVPGEKGVERVSLAYTVRY